LLLVLRFGFVALSALGFGLGCATILGADLDDLTPAPFAAVDGGPEGTTSSSSSSSGNVIGDGTSSSSSSSSSSTGGPKLPRPSNQGAFGDLWSTGGATVALPQDAKFDTSVDCAATSILGACEAKVPSTGGSAACVCRSATMTIKNLTVVGTRALVLFVRESVTIAGTLDVAANAKADGPGADRETADGGAAFVQVDASSSATNADLIPLRGGQSGSFGNGNAAGGGGGGAIQITAGTVINLDPTGIIQAGGGGGEANAFSGGAGGAGGAILIEAPRVRIEGMLLANGGGGGGGGNGSSVGGAGASARTSGKDPATGGTSREGGGCSLQGYTSGGWGGRGGTKSTDPILGGPSDTKNCIPRIDLYAGGNGGGVGAIRINVPTSTGLEIAPGSFSSPSYSTGVLVIQ
jgi:hypothetical protein